MKSKNLIWPLKMVLIAWSAVLLSRQLPLLSFESVSLENTFYVALNLLSISTGYFLSIYLINPTKKTPTYNKTTVNKMAKFISFISMISSAMLFYKFYVLNGTLLFTLQDITQFRFDRARSGDTEMGSLASGVVGYLLSGFSVFSIIYRTYFIEILSRSSARLLYLSFIIGMASSLLSGGRWGVTTGIAVMLIMRTLKNKNPQASNSTERKTIRNKAFTTLIFFTIIFVFSRFFLDRLSSDATGNFLIYVLDNELAGVKLTGFIEDIMNYSDSAATVLFIVGMIQYYLGHSLYQLDILLGAPMPASAPYFLAYQGYLQVLMLNKLGLSLITVSEILSELPNPGVYFTLIGACYLDFGYYTTIFIFLLFGFLLGHTWSRVSRRNSISDLTLFILIFLILVFSPIVSLTSTGILPSMLTLTPLFLILVSFTRVRK